MSRRLGESLIATACKWSGNSSTDCSLSRHLTRGRTKQPCQLVYPCYTDRHNFFLSTWQTSVQGCRVGAAASNPAVHQAICRAVCPSVTFPRHVCLLLYFLNVCLPACLHVCLTAYLSVRWSVHLSSKLTFMSVRECLRQDVCLYVWVPVCLYIRCIQTSRFIFITILQPMPIRTTTMLMMKT